jgi:uncharacterized OsmC-like protein
MSSVINDIDVEALKGVVEQVTADASVGVTSWGVSTTWQGGTRSDSQVSQFSVGGQAVERDFTIRVDEPLELLGTNKFANPQEYLLAAMNACMVVGYAAACSVEGIEIESLRIEASGDIDLRGFLGIDPNVKNGYDEIKYTVYIKGSGTVEQFQAVHEAVIATSPNRFNMANAISLDTNLVVE